MRTDALASPFGRTARSVPLLLLIVLSAATPVFGQDSQLGSPRSPDPASGVVTDVDQPTRLDLPSAVPAAPAPAGQSAAPSLALPGTTGGAAPTSIKLPDISEPENLSSAMQVIILLTVLSLAPAILLMMTCFTRIIIVLSLLRQALGTQQLPPNQVMIGLSMFMTFLVMAPTWQKVNEQALRPYLNGEIKQMDALKRAQAPIREFMIAQIEDRGNVEDVFLFAEFADREKPEPQEWYQVETLTLVPAFMLSELKTAFLIGFQVYLPFLVIDMVISIVLISMGMMMLPPVLISLPFKLLLFVLVDGWHLITKSLMGSFAAVT
jgi:flagellar biosynthetic protein FliP